MKKQGQAARVARGYSIKAKAKEAEIWIYEDIGEYWGVGLSSRQFAKDIQALGEVEQITVHLNSYGGDPFEGAAIYNTLRSNKARVIVNIDGIAASAASIIAMAGDTINIAENGMVMVHEASGLTYGRAEDHARMAESLTQINGAMMNTYLRKVSISEEELADLMAGETWMKADRAIKYGFADQITEPLEMAAHFDLAKYKYKNPPEVKAEADEPAIQPDKSLPSLPKQEEAESEAKAEATPDDPGPTLYGEPLANWYRRDDTKKYDKYRKQEKAN